MPLQGFIDNSLPTIKAAWLNAVDVFYFTLFNSATTAAQARTALGSTSVGDALFITASASAARTSLGLGSAAVEAATAFVPQTLADAKGDMIAASAADTWAKLSVGANGTIPMARSAATLGLAYVAALNKRVYGLTYDVGTDATNDININVGGAMDATGAYWMTLSTALGKQSDVTWAVGGTTGTPAGWLDTGAVGNSDYYVWLIARSDTGVVDSLCSLSSTAPTMPTNYDFKALVGWFKRVGGTIVAFTTLETEGGGLEFRWTAPTLDINQANALTTSRRTDALKVPLNLMTKAHIRATVFDASTGFNAIIQDPAETDVAPSGTAAPLTTFNAPANQRMMDDLWINTSAAGLVAARADLATVDLYAAVTLGFRWSRRV